MNKSKTKKTWYKSWWAIVLFVVIGLIIISSLLPNSNNNTKSTQTESTQEENSIQESVKTCVPNWNCDNWSECSKSNTQTRICTDLNNCGTNSEKPKTSQSCKYNYNLEEILPSMLDFPTEYSRGDIEEIESDNGNLKAYDTNNGFVKGKTFSLSKYEVGSYSVKDYFDVEIMFYEFEKSEDAVNFKENIEKYMEEQGGYSEIKLNVNGNCFNTKEDFGYAGGNVASSVCQEGNIIYWNILSITNSFKDSEDYIEEFIKVIETKF